MEAQSNKKILKAAHKLGWMCQRHEDKFAMGVPDISFVSPYKNGWIETKFTRGDQKLKLRPAQINWLCDRAKLPQFRGYIVLENEGNWFVAEISTDDRTRLLEGIKPSTFHELGRTHEGPLPDILAFIQH